jgi:hypothetical protein
MRRYRFSVLKGAIAAILCAISLELSATSLLAQKLPSAGNAQAVPAPASPAPKPDDSNDPVWIRLGKNGILTPIAAIGAALIGFGGLIWATTRGYRNVINAQKDAADRRRAEKQEEVRFDTRTLALALRGEVAAIKVQCEIHLNFLKALQDEWKDKVAANASVATERIAMAPTPRISATIYEKNADRLGMLGPITVERVAELYSRLISHEPVGSDVRTFVATVDSWIESMTRHMELVELIEFQLAIVAATGDWMAVGRAHQAGKEKAEQDTVAAKGF